MKRMQTRKNRITEWKKLDWLIVLLTVLLSLAPLLPLLGSGSGTAARVCIEQHGEVLYEGSLTTDAVITTPDGSNTVCIENGTVRMIAADCSDGLCLASGAASQARPIVCLPNEVTVTVTKEKEAEYDAVSE